MKKCKELILYLDDSAGFDYEHDLPPCLNFTDTYDAIAQGDKFVATTIPHFLSFQYAERLFVFVYGEIHEITLGDCEGTNREIKESHNIEKMLIAGEFDWFR